MRNLKRVLSLALALVMVLGMMVITTSAADFTDAEEITYTEAVDVMSELGIIKGMGDGTFAPKGTLTREQAAKILAFVTMGAEADEYLTGSAAPFDDVAATKWSAKYVAYCKNLGIINGVGDNKFNPTGTLKVVEFAKMLLVAIEAEGTFTGAGWEANVKDAFNDVDELKATGIKVTNAEITREQACELALAAMKAGEKYSNGWYIDGKETEFGYSESYADAYIMAKALGMSDPITIKKHESTRDSLLETVYGFECKRDTDAFGRPGTLYTNNKTGAELVELWFVDTAVKSYVGEVKGGTVFADLGSPKAAQTFAAYLDGNACNNGTNNAIKTAVAKDSTTALKSGRNVALTGNGVVTEIYANGENAWIVVIVNTYADTVKTVTPAKDDAKAYITLNTSGKTFETEAFAEKDAVLYTMANGVVKTVVKNENYVEGKVTKITSDGVYTIGEGEYTVSNKAGELGLSLDALTAGAWYVDTYGHLIAVKAAPETPATVYYYGVVLGAQGQSYKAAGTADLLGDAADGQEAKEVVQILKADGAVEIIETNWEYTKNAQGKITGVDFINNDDQATVLGSETYNDANAYVKAGLVKYSLVDGKIDEIVAITNANGATGSTMTVNKNDATLANTDKLVSNTTLFIVKDAEDAVIYVGYKSIPAALAATAYEYFYAVKANGDVDTTTVAAVYLTVADVDIQTAPQYGLVWYASTDKYTTKAGNATVTTYTNVYLDGVKGEISFKGDHFAPAAGTLYYYAVDEDGYASTPYNAANGNEGKLDSTKTILKIEDGYYVSEHGSVPVVYVNADTKYFQVDAKTKAVTVVEGLPAIDATGATTIEQISIDWATENNYADMSAEKPAEIVYFTVKEVPEA